jgi:hypothetical protein
MRFREAIDGYLQLVSFLLVIFWAFGSPSLLDITQSPSPWLSAESLKTLTSGVRNVVQQPQQQAQSEQAEKLYS